MSQKMQKPSALHTEEPQGIQEPLPPSKDKKGGGTTGNLAAKSRRLAGSLEVAQILQRMFYWQPKTTITRGGKSWVVFYQDRRLEQSYGPITAQLQDKLAEAKNISEVMTEGAGHFQLETSRAQEVAGQNPRGMT